MRTGGRDWGRAVVQWLRGGVRQALDCFYPRQCCVCQGAAATGFRALCWECVRRFPRVEPPFCERCGDPVDGNVGHRYHCSACRRHEPGFDVARSVLRFRGGVRTALHAFKFDRQLQLAGDLAELAAGYVQAEFNGAFDAVAFVPLHPARERLRGYNQSAMLARALARPVGAGWVDHGLTRVRATESQTRLSARERRHNLRGAFAVRDAGAVLGRRYLLVDDVMTTGATLSECAGVLKRAGAAAVYGLTIARG